VVEELGYYPNTQVRGLVSGRRKIFGLIISEITNPFFPEIVQGFEDVAVQHNYEILTNTTGHDPKRMAFSVRRMIPRLWRHRRLKLQVPKTVPPIPLHHGASAPAPQ
jgi:LacI family transcriptional regulator